MSTTASLAARVDALCGDLTSIRAPRGTDLNARQWSTEAPLRMLLNNLDAEVAERPEDLVVYGGSGKAARNHEALRAIGVLPEALREAFVLHFVEGMDYAEASKITGVAAGTLRVRAHRARTLLRTNLGDVVDTWLREGPAEKSP